MSLLVGVRIPRMRHGTLLVHTPEKARLYSVRGRNAEPYQSISMHRIEPGDVYAYCGRHSAKPGILVVPVDTLQALAGMGVGDSRFRRGDWWVLTHAMNWSLFLPKEEK